VLQLLSTIMLNHGRAYTEVLLRSKLHPPPPPPRRDGQHGHDDPDEGEELLCYLARRYRHSTQAQWAVHIRAERLSIDGVVVSAAGCRLRPGQTLCYRRPPWVEPLPLPPRSLVRLYEDEDVVAVLKPSGVRSVFLEGSASAAHAPADHSPCSSPSASATHPTQHPLRPRGPVVARRAARDAV
jgi:hypothetical protein